MKKAPGVGVYGKRFYVSNSRHRTPPWLRYMIMDFRRTMRNSLLVWHRRPRLCGYSMKHSVSARSFAIRSHQMDSASVVHQVTGLS
jgi:hypothetical protein